MARLLWAAVIGAALSGCGGGGAASSESASASDTTSPAVSSTSPASNATVVATNAAVVVSFGEALATTSASVANLTLSSPGGSVAGSVSVSGATLTLTPASPLAHATTYTATVSGVADGAGNVMVGNHVWSFTTGVAPDTTAPAVSSISPADNATGIAINAALVAGFSEPMAAATIGSTSFTLSQGGSAVAGTVSYNGTTATFTPTASLAYATTYTATLTTAATDAAGNALLAPYVWRFTTGAMPDTTLPTVSSTSPASNVAGVATQAAISAVFSEPMASGGFNTTSFRLRRGGTDVAGAVTYTGNTATFTPAASLADGTTYTATITASVTDTAGNALGADYTWTFTTATATSNLTDTGISASQCNGLGVTALVACSSFDATRLNTQQDGMRGRDVSTPDATDGKLGFRYSAVGSYPLTDCVRDEVTGLVWEGKTASGQRAGNARYTNYDGTTPLQKWNGSAFVEPAQADIDAPTNSVGHKKALNSAGLCGFNDWRLPTADELQSLVDYGVPDPGPQIDTNWFPNTPSFPDQLLWWSSSPDVARSGFAWYVYFGYGSVGMARRDNALIHLRLVRADQ